MTMKRIISSQALVEQEKGPKSHDHDGDGEVSAYAQLKHKLYFLSDMIVGKDLIVVLLASSCVTLVVNNLGGKNLWLSFLSESKPAVSTLGAFYSFALVFRTNICYARWWEGRTLWGSLIVNAIRITQQGRLWIEDEKLIDRLSCLTIAFAYACKAQLRGNSINHEVEDGANLVLRGVLLEEELNMIGQQTAWQSYYCIDAMRAVTNKGLIKDEAQKIPDWRKTSAHEAMETTICNLATAMGGCIRVRSTGLPVAYDDILSAVGTIFFTAACLAWAPGAGFYNPIVVLGLYIVVKMILGVGNDMEDPFGHDESDLPLDRFCATIEKQINAIDERAHLITYDLACGPSLAGSTVDSSNSYDWDIGLEVSESTPLVNNEHK